MQTLAYSASSLFLFSSFVPSRRQATRCCEEGDVSFSLFHSLPPTLLLLSLPPSPSLSRTTVSSLNVWEKRLSERRRERFIGIRRRNRRPYVMERKDGKRGREKDEGFSHFLSPFDCFLRSVKQTASSSISCLPFSLFLADTCLSLAIPCFHTHFSSHRVTVLLSSAWFPFVLRPSRNWEEV